LLNFFVRKSVWFDQVSVQVTVKPRKFVEEICWQ